MSQRPDFGTMNTRDLLISVAQSHWDLKEHLQGNGQPGLCQIRGCEIEHMKKWRERVTGYLKGAAAVVAALFSLVTLALGYLATRK